MTPTHALSVPAPRSAPLVALPRRDPARTPPLLALTPRTAPSVTSGLILAFIVLALLLQASFLVGLARGEPGGPGPRVASAPAARAR